MSLASRQGRRAVAACVLTMLWTLAPGQPVTAGQNPLKRLFGDKDTRYQTFKDSAGRFEIDYPSKDWRLLPGAESSLAVFAHNDGPTLFVDHVRLVDSLTPDEIEALPDLEVDRLKRREPQAKLTSVMLDSKTGNGVLITYSRVGTGPESVTQYTIAVGQDLYRLNGIVPERLLSKFEPIVKHMIQSFKAPANPPNAKN
jgi:hypothetical protein